MMRASAGPRRIRRLAMPTTRRARAHWPAPAPCRCRSADAATSRIPGRAAFTTGLHQDLAAVRAGLTPPRSRGRTGGQPRKLKRLRRQLYGRGNVDLVRKRALRAA